MMSVGEQAITKLSIVADILASAAGTHPGEIAYIDIAVDINDAIARCNSDEDG